MIAMFFWIPHIIKDRASAKKKINIKDQNHWIKDQVQSAIAISAMITSCEIRF